MKIIKIEKNGDSDGDDEMLSGRPNVGNPHVRFDEAEQRDWRKPPVALDSTQIRGFESVFWTASFSSRDLSDGETVHERGPACPGRIDWGDLKSKSGRLLTAVIVEAGE